MEYPIIYRHADGIRTIKIWPDRKERAGFAQAGALSGRALYLGRHGANLQPQVSDEWPILHRAGMSLADEEWEASPGPEWTLEQA